MPGGPSTPGAGRVSRYPSASGVGFYRAGAVSPQRKHEPRDVWNPKQYRVQAALVGMPPDASAPASSHSRAASYFRKMPKMIILWSATAPYIREMP